MYDGHNKYLPKGSKCSPSDLGKDIWNNMVTNCVKWMK